MADTYEKEEFRLTKEDVFITTLTYSCNRGIGFREGVFNRVFYFKVVSKPKPISKQDFIEIFLQKVLVEGLCKMQGRSVRWEKLTVKRLDIREVVVLKKLRGVYGALDKPVDVNKGFLFELYNTLRVYPNRFYIRGVPDDFRQFDRPGFESYRETVMSVEKLFLGDLGNDSFRFRFVTAVRVPDSEFQEVSEINSAEGVRLLSFKQKTRPTKPQPRFLA